MNNFKIYDKNRSCITLSPINIKQLGQGLKRMIETLPAAVNKQDAYRSLATELAAHGLNCKIPNGCFFQNAISDTDQRAASRGLSRKPIVIGQEHIADPSKLFEYVTNLLESIGKGVRGSSKALTTFLDSLFTNKLTNAADHKTLIKNTISNYRNILKDLTKIKTDQSSDQLEVVARGLASAAFGYQFNFNMPDGSGSNYHPGEARFFIKDIDSDDTIKAYFYPAEGDNNSTNWKLRLDIETIGQLHFTIPQNTHTGGMLERLFDYAKTRTIESGNW